MAATEPPIRAFRTRAAWQRWLDSHHGDEAGIWVKFAKKGTGVTTVTYAEALEVALCYGWIDAQVKRLDEVFYLQRFVPRRARSRWSKINRDAATRLIETGAMKPPGLREVERAKADGRWHAAYDSPRTAEMPDDLARALARHPRAGEAFAALTAGRRYTILFNVQEAKRPETRARRIASWVEKLASGEQIG